jgi:hypothetical protein
VGSSVLQFIRLISLFSLSLIIIVSSWAFDTTGTRPGAFGLQSPQDNVERLRQQILCAFEKNDLPTGPTRQRQRAEFVSRHLSDIFSRMEPQWTPLELQHSLAQAVAETGNLKDLVEQPSEYDSSQSRYRGRGIIQTTHRSNYARLAGCAQEIQNNPIPRSISRQAIAQARPINNSELVRNPDQAMSETTEQGQFLNAASLVCYMVDTSERHRRMRDAMNCPNPPCVREVGVAVNHGPGALGRGRTPLGDSHRMRAFCRMNSCFNNQGQCHRGGR